MTNAEKYQAYLSLLRQPFQKLTRLDFLNPDNSVAFSLGNEYMRGYMKSHDTRAFIQSGELSVSLNNGQRRKASVTLSNLDGAFDYAVNKLWYGQRLRLMMGMLLPDGTPFYLPQGVFCISNPSALYSPSARTADLSLVDKWAMLDGTLLGTVDRSYTVYAKNNGVSANVFDAMAAVLRLSRYDFKTMETDPTRMLDGTKPVFTDYYAGKSYRLPDGGSANVTDVPYDITVGGGQTYANILLQLNDTLAAWIGYDESGALRVDPSQNDISDSEKPTLWNFSMDDKSICSINETAKNAEVYNDVIVVGQGLTGYEIWGRAQNYDPSSGTDINRIGMRTFYEAKSEYWNSEQCADLAEFYLKRKTVLQKSVTIEAPQIFHLRENNLVSIKRTDKPGAPTEKHLIQSFSIPLSLSGTMSITATSVSDYPQITRKFSEE